MHSTGTELPPDWSRTMARTGLHLTAVTLGGSALGEIQPPTEGMATVRAALESPIRSLDTSNGYADGDSERRIGQVLAAAGAMREVCESAGTDLRTAALQFSTRDPRFATTVVGMSHPDRVAATVESASAELPGSLWDELEALVPPRQVWLDHRED